MFGVTRVPKLEGDYLVKEFPSTSKHILLLLQDQIFVVFVYSETDGSRLTVAEIQMYHYLTQSISKDC
jgi:Choline/Carnitine o-acyltransferase